jgi:hypothetical protein
VETDIEKVKRKSDEEFHFWLEPKVEEAKREAALAKKKLQNLQAKRGH